ncbi:hypothetical protein CCACVL1_22842 [Corchorus capsularis]|uniref:Disease resistance protein At4g27190-like leucine-rich repeats domain-containing protein n=1 Tax=Corchorus capsularis TaxID=210143 RepID=A0A1R3GWC5_COCAP|nr:hypothetical protein CCACVL1_22842 [Corchorus capsularis]
MLIRLGLFNGGKWKKIWHDNLTPKSFGKLEHLRLDRCNGLSSIFPSNMVDRLQALMVMNISHCDDLESIIEPSGLPSTESSFKLVFSKVEILLFESLSKLKSFHPSMHTTEWPSLEELVVTGCTSVKTFASENLNSQLDEQPLFWFSKEAFPNLKKLRTDSDEEAKEILELSNYVVLPSLKELQLSPFIKKSILPSDKLQRLWHDQLPEMSCYFLNLKQLKLEGYNFLNYVFPSSVAENFVHLKGLLISDCDNVKEVIVMDNLEEEEGRVIKVFPRLKVMMLKRLPKLVTFCYGDHIEFPMLNGLAMLDCREFITFVSNSMIGNEPQVDLEVGRNNSKDDVLCLFNDKEAFPCLQKMKTDQDEAKEILELTNSQGVRFIQKEEEDSDFDFDIDSDIDLVDDDEQEEAEEEEEQEQERL